MTAPQLDETTRTELEAAAFRRLVQHLRERTDVQNIDMMNLAGFCRNCLSRWYREEVLKLFAEVDAILAPATPCTAPLIGQQTFMLDDVELPVRANLGLYTQPISFIGLPVVAVPVPLAPLPIAVQIIAAPWREDIGLRIAYALEAQGVVAAPRPAL